MPISTPVARARRRCSTSRRIAARHGTVPSGTRGARAGTLGDELILADADLGACRQGKEKMFNFAAHRRPQWYGPIVNQVGATAPPGGAPGGRGGGPPSPRTAARNGTVPS